jgi:uncharacterized DUF497 family protein
MAMQIEFDPAKDAINIAKHGISLASAVDLDILAFIEDDRTDYGEVRYRAWGLIDGKAYCLAFTDRTDSLRAISLRRAHKKEMDRHVPSDRD